MACPYKVQQHIPHTQTALVHCLSPRNTMFNIVIVRSEYFCFIFCMKELKNSKPFEQLLPHTNGLYGTYGLLSFPLSKPSWLHGWCY